ncbi:hypothetical protein RFI_32983, partial [Reticulomyxa filosa]
KEIQHGKELVSQTSILKFIGVKEKAFVKKLKAIMENVVCAFQSQMKIEELQSIAEQFNSRQQSKSQELDNDEKQESKNKKQSITFCSIFKKDYKYRILKRIVASRESPQEVVDTLEELGYEVE